MFSDVIRKISWDDTTEKIMAKTDGDVRRALSKRHPDVEDFMAMISPAADKYLEQMAHLSRMYTRERFGKTINMFIPIYITNSCANSCVYCGFHVQNKMPRTILTESEIVREYEAIKKPCPVRQPAGADGRESSSRRSKLYSSRFRFGQALFQQSAGGGYAAVGR